MACSVNRETITLGIQDAVAKSLDASKLFNRVSPTEDMSSILEDAKKYAPDVLGMYRTGFLENPEDFLRSIAEQSASSPSEAEGALAAAGIDLTELANRYYNQHLFSPKDINSPYKEIIQSINNQYSEEIIKRLESERKIPIYQISPSEKLVDIYEREYTQENAEYSDSRQRISDEDYASILEELELKAISTPQEFIDKNMQEYSTQIANFRKANPNFTMEFNDEDTKYDENKNIILVDLTELNSIAIQHNVPLKQVVSTMIIHEMAHAASSKAIKIEDNRSALGQLYLAAINHHIEKIPFEDIMRQGFDSPNRQPYALQNIHEFVAETFSNPYFQEYLQSIPYEGEKTLWQSIIDAIFKFFGFNEQTKPSLYDEIVKFVNSEKIQRDNRDAVSHPSTEWNPQLVYRGTPKTYTQAAFELFTSPNVTSEINDVIKKLPSAIIKIKKQLDYETDKDKIKKLQSLLNAYNDVKENDNVLNVSINMLVQAGFIARDMEQQLIEIPTLKDDAKKLTLAYSLLRNTEALEFIKPLAQDVTRIILREGESAAIRPFLNVLRGITSTVDSVKDTFVKVAQPLILKQLTDFVGETEAEKIINQTISSLKARLASTQDAVLKGIIDRQIILEQEKLKLVPNRTNIEAVFQGLYRDSSSSQLLFEAGMMNDHPIPSTVMKILRQNNISVSQGMVSVQNEHQKQLDMLKSAVGKSSIRSTEKFYEPITTLVSRADEIALDENNEPIIVDGKPTFKYTTQRMLLSEYSPEYIKEATEKKVLVDYYFRKLSEADRNDNEEALKIYRDKLNQAYKERREFYRANSEHQYTDEIIDMYELLEKEIVKPDGTTTTFGKERGYIFEAIEDAEQRREEEINVDVLSKLQDEIEGLYIKQRELKSKYNEDGTEKTGFEKQLSDIANQYAELKSKYGSYEITERGQAMFEKEVLSLQKRLEGNFISQAEHDRRLSEITVTELSDEYYTAVKYYLDRIGEVSKELADIPEFRSIFKGVSADTIREGYAKIRDLTRAFRDNEMTIDGQLFSKVRPELVKEIQKIQQDVEDLKGISEKLRGISIEDNIRARELRGLKNSGEISEDELDELNTLEGKVANSNRLYLQYKELIDSYSELLKQFSELNDSSPSKYYQDELENQKGILIAQKVESILQQIKNSDSIQEGKYQKRNGAWEEVKRVEQGFKVVDAIEKNGFATVEEALANKIAREQATDDVRLTDWWKDNHYEKYVWTKKGYTKIQSPIYIWVKTEPEDKSFIKEKQPSIKFKTYKIHDQYKNSNFRVISDNIAVPKAGRFVDDRYQKLKNSSAATDKAYFQYLEFARKSFERAQKFIPEERRLGDILPSFVKTEDELTVETTNNVAGRAMNVLSGNVKLAFEKSDNPDEQILTGGSTTDFFAKNRVLPIRFSGRMDSKKQSADIPAMLLSYELAAMEYNKQLEDQPLLEAIRIAVEDLPVQESRRLASKFSIANMFSAIKSKKITREKKTEKSTLSKTVDHVLDTYLYGHTKQNADIVIAGMDYDLNKASRGLKKISSLSIFALNAFVAVKNTISATIQGNINSNISKGFFTKAQYDKAHIEAIGHVKDYLLDYRRFGNKTKIGQEMDFFQVLQGASYNEFGQKTAWTVLKNTTNFLTAIKNSSEFELQVAQYLAMSKANPVEVNGKWVEMRKAFELDKDGNLVPVAGAKITQKQIEAFIFKLSYVNRVINGAYRAEEKNSLQKNILGDLVFYLNGYMVPSIVNRFGKTRYSAEADIVTRGYINQTVSFIGDLIKYRTDIAKRWSTMSTDEKHRVLRGTKELLAIIGMAAMVIALGGNADKKELRQNAAIQNWALSLGLAVKAETETFVPIPGMGLNDMARKMNSPFAAVRQISNMIKTLQNFTLYAGDKIGIDAPSAYYKHTTYKDGFHDKGDAKFVANFLKLVGWSGIAFDPVEKALQQKNIQTLR